MIKELGDTSSLVNGESEVLNVIQSVDFYDFFDRKFSKFGEIDVEHYIGYMFKVADEKGLTHDMFKVITADETKQKMLRDTLLRSFTFDIMANNGRSVSDFKGHILHVLDICGLDGVEDESVLDALAKDIEDTSAAFSAKLIMSERGGVPRDIHSAFICTYDSNGLRMSDLSECSDQVKRSILTKLDEYIDFIKSLVCTIRQNTDELNSFKGDVDGAFDYIVKNDKFKKPFSYDDNVKGMLNSVLGRVDECSEWLDDNFNAINDSMFRSGDDIQKKDYGYLASSLNGVFKRTNFVDDIASGRMGKIGWMMKFLFGDKHGNYNITINVGGEYYLIENFIYSGIMACELETSETDYSKDLLGRYGKVNDPGKYGSLTGANDYRFALRTNLVYYTWQSLA